MRRAHRLELAFVLVWSLAATACSPTLGGVIRKYGYSELTPPSRLLAPGTMVVVTNTSPFEAEILCTQESSVGKGFATDVSATQDTEVASQFSGAFQLSAALANQVKANASFSMVKKVTAHITNATVISTSDSHVLRSLDNRTPYCLSAIAQRRKAGFAVSMVASVLQADVDYTVDFDASMKLDAQAKQAVLKDLSAALAADVSDSDKSVISAKGIFWGVVPDNYLAGLRRDPQADAAAAQPAAAVTASTPASH